MEYLPNIIFAIILIAGIGYFANNVKKLVRNIKLGHKVDANDHKSERWKNVINIALGQSKTTSLWFSSRYCLCWFRYHKY